MLVYQRGSTPTEITEALGVDGASPLTAQFGVKGTMGKEIQQKLSLSL